MITLERNKSDFTHYQGQVKSAEFLANPAKHRLSMCEEERAEERYSTAHCKHMHGKGTEVSFCDYVTLAEGKGA